MSKQFSTLVPEVFLDFSPLEMREPRSLSLFLSWCFAALTSQAEKNQEKRLGLGLTVEVESIISNSSESLSLDKPYAELC